MKPMVGRRCDLPWVGATTYHRVRLRVGVEGTKGREAESPLYLLLNTKTDGRVSELRYRKEG